MQEDFKINQETEFKENNESDENHNIAKKLFFTIWSFLKIIIIAALIVLPIRYFLFQPFIVKGESMVPNFHSGDYLIIDEISYKFTEIQRGDVVVLKYPLDQSQRFIKRIIGLPGETVEIRNGRIIIHQNEEELMLSEKYLDNSLITKGDVKISLGENDYFVLGDNRQFSYDSRSWGILPKNNIIGRALLRLFPVGSISYIQAPSY